MTTIKTINAPISNNANNANNANNNTNNNNMYADARFSCNICLDAVMEPVVTQCGHLYCWPCLYRWLEPGMSHIDRMRLNQTSNTTSSSSSNTTSSFQQQQILSNTRTNINNNSNGDTSRQVCPVCKAGCTIATIVPIYVRADSPAPVIENSTLQQSTTTTTTTTTKTTSTATTPLRSNNNNNNNNSSSTSSNINRTNSDDVDIQSIDEDNNDNNNIATTTTTTHNNMIDLDDILSLEDEEEDNDDNEDHVMELYNDTTTGTTTNGLRQRRGNNGNNSVPRRPTATTPLSSSTTLFTISSARNRSNSVPFIHRFDVDAATTSTTNDNYNATGSNTSMIIRGRGLSSFFNNTTSSTNPVDEINSSIDDPAATEYLSRILLLLGSFVILCLLLF